MAKKKHKPRATFRKNSQTSARENDLTRGYHGDGESDAAAEDAPSHERVSGKGRFTRKRTISGAELVEGESGPQLLPDFDRELCVAGRVLRVQGLVSTVRGDDGRSYACATRQLLKQIAIDARHAVAAGDRVWLRPERSSGIRQESEWHEGIIERVEPRHGALSRTSRNRRHLIAVNLDQLVIVTSAAEPRLKPHLVDRFLITAEKTGLKPLVVINKVDLIDPADLMPLVGVYAQLGYRALLVSAQTGLGVDRLRERLAGRVSALSGQSGVGKSSLLNAVEPGLGLRVGAVSNETQKGKHTTTTAELLPLESDWADGGAVIDTPGIRQFALWDVEPEEVAGFFRDLRPYVSRCRFPDCTHTHEDFCAVKDAVADGWIDSRRYESYVQTHAGDEA
ncbi:putative ribosome biogenesis GTPase RsgA [Pseudobythopirellula maris]|uniref:Small ribosomal subunit biogenesis GTPase RsgA n=1 Tax=Pseudobythopirellula maris TaxID=2527991 RepID=A0A5C5ZSP5_9BACT|nr:ribosome small subunit-dependent GTPase A [Pseudobythopirellula maris]TWT90529.1 putative ribosome biogenesis GTPase RsgA [Pseudobythopirellula maris]